MDASGLVGRRAELALLADVLVSGRGALLVGEAGIGKSALLAAALERLPPDVRVLSTRATQAEVRLPWVGLVDLLEEVPNDVLRGLPVPQREALEVALMRRPSGQARDDLAVRLALLGVLRMLAAAGPVVLAVDDAPWLDVETAEALAFTVRRRGGALWCVVATARAGTEAELTALLPPDAARLDVRGLAEDELGTIIRRRVDAALPPVTRRALLRAAAGNPYLALELAEQLSRCSAQAALPVPTALADLLRVRLAAAGAPTRQVLLAAVCLQRPSIEVLARALDVDLDAVLPAPGLARVDGEAVVLEHPLVGSVLLADATPWEREAIHALLAAAVDDPVEQARHAALAEPGPSAAVAARLEDGARLAAARAASTTAAELWELALARTPLREVQNRRRRRLQAAHAALAVGDTGAATAHGRHLLGEVAHGPERAAALLLLADACGQAVPVAMRLLGEALQHAGEDPALLGQIRFSRTTALFVAGDLEAAGREAAAAAALHRQVPGPPLVADLAMLALTESVLGRDPTALVDEALAHEALHGPPTRYTSVHVTRAVLAVHDDRPHDAVRVLQPLWREADAAGEVLEAASLALHLTEALVVAGSAPEAVHASTWALDIARDAGMPCGPQLYAAGLATALAGDLDAATALAQEAEQESLVARDEVFVVQARYVAGHAALAARDPVTAVDAFRRLRDQPLTAQVADPAVFRWQADAVEALLAVGEVDEAAALLAVAERQAAARGRRSRIAAAARARGLLQCALGNAEAALEDLAVAARALDGLQVPVEHGRLALARAVVLRRLRRRAAARDAAMAAVAHLAVAPAWRAQAEEALAGLGLVRTSAALTEVEHRVAVLVAQGRTNAEVGRALFMSSKTVEAHLSRVYRKLDVPGRAALGHALQGSSPMSQGALRS